MIRYERPKVIEAVCDACGGSLVQEENVNCSRLKNDFGWPSARFDALHDRRIELHFCEDCTVKLLDFFRIDHRRFCE